jgi:hypothetical protein
VTSTTWLPVWIGIGGERIAKVHPEHARRAREALAGREVRPVVEHGHVHAEQRADLRERLGARALRPR